MEDPNIDDGDQNRETEIAPALIAVHPAHQSVAVAVGSDLRVFNLQYYAFLVLLSFLKKTSV